MKYVSSELTILEEGKGKREIMCVCVCVCVCVWRGGGGGGGGGFMHAYTTLSVILVCFSVYCDWRQPHIGHYP